MTAGVAAAGAAVVAGAVAPRTVRAELKGKTKHSVCRWCYQKTPLEELCTKAKAAGVDVTLEEWEDMFHIWHFFAGMLPEGLQAIERIGEFVRQRTAGAVAAIA